MSMASSNEYYPWLLTLNISNFVSVKPWLKDGETSTNYKIWREQMLSLLESQDLLGYINEEIQIPECGNGTTSSNDMKIDKHKLWRRTDGLVKGWILGSIGDDVLNALKGLNKTSSSREVWKEVENIFCQKQEENVFGNLDFSKHLELNKAVTKGDWRAASNLDDLDEDVVGALIDHAVGTALHDSVGPWNANDIGVILSNLRPNSAIASPYAKGTALHVAACLGNKGAVHMLVNSRPELLYYLNESKELPIHVAAIYCHKNILCYLITNSKEEVENSPFVGQLGTKLLAYVISSEFLDVALYLVNTYPHMATPEHEEGIDALSVIAGKSHLFPSGERFNWWQNFIYSLIPVTWTPKISCVGDIENQDSQATNSANQGIPLTWTPNASYAGDIESLGTNSQDSQATISIEERFNQLKNFICSRFSNFIAIIWTVLEYLVPAIKDIRHKKVLHKQAIELVKCFCEKLDPWSATKSSGIPRRSVIIAAENGIHEVVELIADRFPLAVSSTRNDIMKLAILNRHKNVYNVIYQMNYGKNIVSRHLDSSGNNLIHMSAKLAPLHKLNLIPGAALQMQRELQWFKEIESLVTTSRRMLKNKHGETPTMLFTREHEDLKRQGEKWMKDTASSCSITAALIATVVFAAAFTAPGGIDSNTGIPILWDKSPFILFAISDIISLFTSVTSLLMFLSILTSRYAEEDFLHALPKRLCTGLLTLFISVTFMVIAFSATAYLTFRQKIGSLLIIPVAALACLPITSFVHLQFPILMDVVHATKSQGIFRKKSDHSLY